MDAENWGKNETFTLMEETLSADIRSVADSPQWPSTVGSKEESVS